MRWYSRPLDGGAGAPAERARDVNAPLVSVVITTRDRPTQLVAAVRSVLANSVRAIEVLVVDQSDGPETRMALHTHFGDDSRVWHIPDAGRGSARGRNLGMAQARADMIAITDDDCLVGPEWIADHLAAFARHPDVAIVFGAVDAPPHDYHKLIVPVELLEERRVERNLTGHAARLEGISAHVSLRRDLVRDLGGFDPRFGPGGERWSGEDYELHYRALCAGHAVLIEPAIAVMHLGMRPLADAWALWRRDAMSCGALTARIVRDGHRLAACRFWWWNIGRVMANAFFHIIRFQYPAGVRLAFWMAGHSLRGFWAEWRAPGEPVTASGAALSQDGEPLVWEKSAV